jgi:hypothetical protein
MLQQWYLLAGFAIVSGYRRICLFQLGKYLTPCHSKLTVDTPGFELSNHPGLLSFEILTEALNSALRRFFVHDKKLTKEEVKTYFTLLCINKSTIEYFTRCCCN